MNDWRMSWVFVNPDLIAWSWRRYGEPRAYRQPRTTLWMLQHSAC